MNSNLKVSDHTVPTLWFEHMLDPPSRARLFAFLTNFERFYPAGSHIKDETDQSAAKYISLEGWAAMIKSLPEGQTQIIDFRLPGDFTDLVSADGETAAIGFEAITDVSIAVVPVKDWIELKKSMPALSLVHERSATLIRSRIVERMLRLGRGNGEQRLAYALLELAVRSGAVHNGRIGYFSVPLTQQRLGDFMGLTSIHICRTLRRMRDHGLITASDHLNICVLNLGALEDLAGIPVSSLMKAIMPPR